MEGVRVIVKGHDGLVGKGDDRGHCSWVGFGILTSASPDNEINLVLMKVAFGSWYR